MSLKFISRAVLAVGLASVARAQPAATMPATTQAVVIDQSTPRAAVKTFILGMTSGDEAAMRAVLIAQNPLEQKLLDALIAQQVAIARFQVLSNATLGPGATRRLLGNVDRDRNAAIKALPREKEQISGDNATVGEDEQEETLVRRNGKWVMTLASMIPVACGASGTDEESINESANGMNIRAKIYSETADELKAGKYKTVAQVRRALESKSAKAADDGGPTTTQTVKSPPPADAEALARAQRDIETLKKTLTKKTSAELIAAFVPKGSQGYGSYEYFRDYMANLAIRAELAARGADARDALERHAKDATRIMEAVNGPGDTVGRICQQLLTALGKPGDSSRGG